MRAGRERRRSKVTLTAVRARAKGFSWMVGAWGERELQQRYLCEETALQRALMNHLDFLSSSTLLDDDEDSMKDRSTRREKSSSLAAIFLF